MSKNKKKKKKSSKAQYDNKNKNISAVKASEKSSMIEEKDTSFDISHVKPSKSRNVILRIGSLLCAMERNWIKVVKQTLINCINVIWLSC